ncbi:MAG: class I SAM-dependent methyltransferase [Candidatus Dormibacteria bacterium]
MPSDGDSYLTDVHRWWHSSVASSELVDAVTDGFLTAPARVLDLGCGLGTEAAFLADRGFDVCGIDLSEVAVDRAAAAHPGLRWVVGDVRTLPFSDGSFDVLIDRGMFHYLAPEDRGTYALEAKRVLTPQGRLLLRACLFSAGVRNTMDADVVTSTFRDWDVQRLRREDLPSDARVMPALVVRMQRAGE